MLLIVFKGALSCVVQLSVMDKTLKYIEMRSDLADIRTTRRYEAILNDKKWQVRFTCPLRILYNLYVLQIPTSSIHLDFKAHMLTISLCDMQIAVHYEKESMYFSHRCPLLWRQILRGSRVGGRLYTHVQSSSSKRWYADPRSYCVRSLIRG